MSRILVSILFFLFVMSCDVANMDNVPASIKDENPSNVFYTLSTSDLSIDPTAFAQLKNINSLVVSQLPVNGEAKFIENGYVYYRSTKPNAKDDVFMIGGKSTDGTSVNEEVKINFVSSQAQLPCYAGTLGDKAKAETERIVEINVLANDKTCSTIENNSLVIEIQPKNGKAEVINQKIVYTSNKYFVGTDLFFYRVGINTKKNPVAPVEVSVSESVNCINGMNNDIINVLSYTPNSDLQLDVLQNDILCDKYKNADLKILTNSTTGTLRVEKNNANKSLIYFNADVAPKGVQTFEYALFRTEKNYIKATVSINFN